MWIHWGEGQTAPAKDSVSFPVFWSQTRVETQGQGWGETWGELEEGNNVIKYIV